MSVSLLRTSCRPSPINTTHKGEVKTLSTLARGRSEERGVMNSEFRIPDFPFGVLCSVFCVPPIVVPPNEVRGI